MTMMQTGFYGVGGGGGGVSFSQLTAFGSTLYFQPASIACSSSSGMFVAAGYEVHQYPVFSTSLNGTTWTAPAVCTAATTSVIVRGIAVSSSSTFVMVGNFNGTAPPYYLSSSGGASWSTPAPMGGTNGTVGGVICTGSNNFIAVGSNTSGQACFQSALNGSGWSSLSLMGTATVTYMNAIAQDSSSNYMCAVGGNTAAQNLSGSTAVGRYSISTNGGSTWSTPSLFNGSTTSFYPLAVAISGSGPSSTMVAVGTSDGTSVGISGLPVYSVSTNGGTTWTTPATIGTTTGLELSSIIALPSGKFLAFGAGPGQLPRYMTYTTAGGWVPTAGTPVPNTGTYANGALTGMARNSTGTVVAVQATNYGVWTSASGVS